MWPTDEGVFEMQSKIIRWASLLALVIAPVVLAEDLFYVGEGDDQDAPRAYTLFSSADDSAFLGVTMEEEIEHDEGGAKITSVVDDSPAAKAGLEEGDIVVDFGGDTVRGPVSLTKKIRDREPGDSVRITVLRDGRRKTFDVELGERSMQWGSAYGVAPRILKQLENIQVPNIDMEELAERLEGLNFQHLEGLEHLEELEGMNFNFDFKNFEDLQGQFRDDFSFKCEDGECLYNNMFFSSKPRLGVQLTDTTPELREHLGGSRDAGVLVGKVIDDSAAEEAGVEVGDLIVAVGDDEIGSTNHARRRGRGPAFRPARPLPCVAAPGGSGRARGDGPDARNIRLGYGRAGRPDARHGPAPRGDPGTPENARPEGRSGPRGAAAAVQ